MGDLIVVKILYSAAALQGVFMGALLVRTHVNQPANRILAILLFIISFHLVLVGFDNRDFFMAFPHLSRISWIIGSLYWPLIFLFVQHITGTPFRSKWKNLLLFIPFAVLLIIMLPYYLQSTESKRALLTHFEKASEADFGWLNEVVSLLHIVFQGLCLAYYLSVEKKLKDEYSAIDAVRVTWLKQFLVITFLVTLLAVVSFFARDLRWPLVSKAYSFHFIGIVFIFYWLSYKALTHPVLFGLHPMPTIPATSPAQAPLPGTEEKYSRSSLEEDRSMRIFEAVRQLLEDEKLYRKNDLTLTDLATRMNMPRHHVSQAINSQYAGNFFDLINELRVKEFKLMALDPSKKHLSLLGIARDAGFNSKASFYAIFKKKTGMTPAEYIGSQSEPVK